MLMFIYPHLTHATRVLKLWGLWPALSGGGFYQIPRQLFETSWSPGVARVYRGLSSWTLLKLSVAFRYNVRDQLLPSIYRWLRNRCLAINNSSLLVSADMSHLPVVWQRPGWNIHISSDISALWPECHISPCLYSSLYLYNQVRQENETIPFTEK
jgi:hypothetical protein